MKHFTIKDRILFRSNHFTIIKDLYPVTPGHLLIISNNDKRIHFFDLSRKEVAELPDVIHIAKALIEGKNNPDGYNIGMNCGEAAGQTVMHFHCHVIPRYVGDTEHPKGGVRGVIESKRSYSEKSN